MPTTLYSGGNLKNVSIGELDEFLRWRMDTKRGDNTSVYTLFRSVPWLGRGISLVAQAIRDYPFQIVDESNRVVDTSKNWQNVLGFTDNFFNLLYLVAASTWLRGKAYVFPNRNRIAIKSLQYLNPDSVDVVIDEHEGLKKFVRHTGTAQIEILPKDLIYAWLLDPQVEIGPPNSYPGQNAINAAGMLFDLDEFFRHYAQSGLVKAFVAYAKGMPKQDQRNKLSEYLSRMMTGIKNIGRIEVLEADAVTITPVGEGLRELENVTLTKEKREDISVALGVPQSMLWSSEASGLGGGGVTQEDTYRFYKLTVVPHFDFIADIFNRQLFVPLGYRLVGLPETIDVFQEDEVQRSQALSSIVSAINTDPQAAKFTMSLLGYDLNDRQQAELDALILEKQANAERMAQQLQQAPTESASSEPSEDDKEPTAEQKAIERRQYRVWASKPHKRAFEFRFLNAQEQAELMNEQMTLKAIEADAWRGYP